MPSQQQASNTPLEERNLWRTPLYVFRWAEWMWGPFDVDLAADADNALCEQYITREENALSKSWGSYGRTGWCNPPYDNIEPWILKAALERRHGFTTVLLIPAFNGEVYHQTTFDEAGAIRFIVGRLGFHRPSGEPVQGNTRGSMLALFLAGKVPQSIKAITREQMQTDPIRSLL